MAMAMSTTIQLLFPPSSSPPPPHPPPKPLQNPISSQPFISLKPKNIANSTRRLLLVATTSSLSSLLSLTLQYPFPPISSAQPSSSPSPSSSSSSSSSSSLLSGIANTKSWFQFYGDGFSIRVPPQFEDIAEPEDYNAGQSLYGDKVKPKTFAARFASTDGSEVISVITRPTNQLKITFLEAQDITDLGSLKEAAKIFVPGGASLYSARTIKIKEDEGYRTYYFYEFGKYDQRVALVAAVNGGKAFVAGATAPQYKWDDDGVKLRSAAISLTML